MARGGGCGRLAAVPGVPPAAPAEEVDSSVVWEVRTADLAGSKVSSFSSLAGEIAIHVDTGAEAAGAEEGIERGVDLRKKFGFELMPVIEIGFGSFWHRRLRRRAGG